MIIGAKKTFKFFFQKRKAKGTACFLGGILMVLYGWAMIGERAHARRGARASDGVAEGAAGSASLAAELQQRRSHA
eukprot:4010548-Prymnesium_polylepis.2